MAKAKRMQIKFGELSQEIAITHGVAQSTVDLVLNAYSAAVKRALAEDFIVEALSDVRLQIEDYYDARNSRRLKRIAVNAEHDRKRTKKHSQPSAQIEEEDERATEKLSEKLS